MFKRIVNILKRFNPFQIPEKEPSFTKKLVEAKKDLEDISLKQEEVRNNLVKIEKSKRVETLDITQEVLIDQRVEKINLNNSWKESVRVRSLLKEIELLATNDRLAENDQIEYKEVDPKLVDELSKPLVHSEYIDAYRQINKRRGGIEDARKKDIEEIKRLKKDLSEFSLVQNNIKRIEQRQEQEIIEKERKKKEQYASLLSKSEILLKEKSYKAALHQLDEALKIIPGKVHEIEDFKEIVLIEEKEFSKLSQDFRKLFLKAENKANKGEIEVSIRLFLEAKELNFNNRLCDQKIALLSAEADRKKKLKEEADRKARVAKLKKQKFKDDAEAIVNYFTENDIKEFYHYTDSRNVNSIIQNNGLLSLNELRRRKIPFVQGSETSEMPDFVRLSYTKNHPLMHISIQQARITSVKVLSIDNHVSTLRYTQFSDVNVARTSTPPIVSIGSDIEFIKQNIRLSVVKQKNHFDLSDEDKPYYQAEVLVKDNLPLEYITNL